MRQLITIRSSKYPCTLYISLPLAAGIDGNRVSVNPRRPISGEAEQLSPELNSGYRGL
jgi:hypothetical protein